MLERYGAETWFGLGDRDMATHIRRTQLLRGGASLTQATAALCERLDVPARLLPMTDDEVRTQIRTPDGWLEFQEYFVKRGQADEVLEIRRLGIAQARPTVQVLEAVTAAQLIVIAPSNPFVSVGTILALPGMLEALLEAPAPIVAVSPLVGGAALRGPADKMLRSLGGTPSASGVVGHYRQRYPGLVDSFVLDEIDAAEAPALEAAGANIELLPTVMRTYDDRQALAEAILEAHSPA
jgi:LPPG:FO 2-phospho-L-lactate transferase